MKDVVGLVATILVFIAYVPYLRDILKGKTKPHVYSWFVWGFLAAILFALQLQGGGGAGAYVTLSAVTVTFIVFFLGLKDGKKDITLSDTVFFVAALFATALWLFAKQPVLSVVLLVTIDILGFIPTVRKSWNKPYGETLFTWELNGFRYCLAIVALQRYNMLTLFYPATWALANILFSLMLIVRRKQLSS